MNRQTPNKRHRAGLALAALVCVGVGLSTPLFIDASRNEFSLHTAAVIAATRDSFALSAPIALPMLPSVTIESGTLSVAASAPGDSLTGAAMLALLTGGKAKLVLNEATLLLAPNRKANSATGAASKPANGGGENSVAPILSALMKLSFSQLELRDSSLKIEHADGSHEVISKVALEVSQHERGQTRAVGSLVFRNRPVSFDVVVTTQAQLTDDPAERGKSMIGRKLDIALKSDLIEFSAHGSLSAGEYPQYTTTTSEIIVSNVRDTARWLGLQWADGRGLGAFRADGPLSWSTSEIAFPDAAFHLDGNRATGALALKLNGKRPAFDGTLDFASFDVSPYLPKPKAAGETTSFDFTNYFTPSNGGAGVFPLLDQIDADLRISADTVTAGATTFGKGAASLSLRDGMLLADLAELELGKGARCGGQFGIQASDGTPRYTLRGKIESIDLSVLTNVLWSYGVLSGAGDVTLDLNARGLDRKTILGSVGGKAGISQAETGQIGIDLRTLAATARAQVQKGWGGATRGQTSIDSLNAQFSLRNGQLTTERVSARAGDAALQAVGSINLLDSVSDLKVWITHPAVDAATAATVTGAIKPAKANAPAAVPAPVAATRTSTPAEAKPADSKAPGGGLHFLGPLDAPEIRFVPLSERPAHEVVPNAAPRSAPQVPAGSG